MAAGVVAASCVDLGLRRGEGTVGAIGIGSDGHQGIAFKADQRDADRGVGRGDDGGDLVVGQKPVTDAAKELGRLLRVRGDVGRAADTRKQRHER